LRKCSWKKSNYFYPDPQPQISNQNDVAERGRAKWNRGRERKIGGERLQGASGGLGIDTVEERGYWLALAFTMIAAEMTKEKRREEKRWEEEVAEKEDESYSDDEDIGGQE